MWKRTENGFQVTIQLNPFKALSKVLEKTAGWLGDLADHLSPEQTAAANAPATPDPSPQTKTDVSDCQLKADEAPDDGVHSPAGLSVATRTAGKQGKRFDAAQHYDAASNCLRLDLHGCTIRQAELTLHQKIRECYENGIRFLDVVYGFSGRKVAEAVNGKLYRDEIKRYICGHRHIQMNHGKVIPCNTVDESTGVVLVITMNPIESVSSMSAVNRGRCIVRDCHAYYLASKPLPEKRLRRSKQLKIRHYRKALQP